MRDKQRLLVSVAIAVLIHAVVFLALTAADLGASRELSSPPVYIRLDDFAQAPVEEDAPPPADMSETSDTPETPAAPDPPETSESPAPEASVPGEDPTREGAGAAGESAPDRESGGEESPGRDRPSREPGPADGRQEPSGGAQDGAEAAEPARPPVGPTLEELEAEREARARAREQARRRSQTTEPAPNADPSSERGLSSAERRSLEEQERRLQDWFAEQAAERDSRRDQARQTGEEGDSRVDEQSDRIAEQLRRRLSEIQSQLAGNDDPTAEGDTSPGEGPADAADGLSDDPPATGPDPADVGIDFQGEGGGDRLLPGFDYGAPELTASDFEGDVPTRLEIVVEFTVGPDGTVVPGSVETVRGSGYPSVDRIIEATVRAWPFLDAGGGGSVPGRKTFVYTRRQIQ